MSSPYSTSLPVSVPETSCDNSSPRLLPPVPDENCDNRFSFHNITQSDVLLAFAKIKSNATGVDNIEPRFFKILLPKLLPYVCHLFNTILTTSTYPKQWKLAKILPVLKPNGDFRPIAILSYLSKAFEHLCLVQMHEFISSNSLLNTKQSGFRKNRSCATTIIDVTEEIRVFHDKKFVTFLLLLDFSKAFDTIDHNILCSKLYNKFRFSKTAVKLIKSYLTGRHQAVYLPSRNSCFLPVSTGVPQGSILGPLLLSIYINDLPDTLRHCNYHLYADDVQLYYSCCPSDVEHAIALINEDLRALFNWSCLKKLLLNPSKSKCIVVNKNNFPTESISKLTVNSEPIEYVNKAKNLGFTFNNTLNWDHHINEAIFKTVGKIRALWRTQKLLPQHVRQLIAKTYLLPTLFYGVEAFAGCREESRRKLNVALNDIARYVFAIHRGEHITSFANKLLGMPFGKYME